MNPTKYIPKVFNGNFVPADTYNRNNQAIKQALNESSEEIQIRTAEADLFRVNDSDRYIKADSRKGPVTIVLTLPRIKQELTVKNITRSGNAVIIKTIDGKPTGDGVTFYMLDPMKFINLLCDGTNWFEV